MQAMLGWYKKLFERGPANAEKSTLGCLVANVLITLVIALIAWLAGGSIVAFGQ